jgi:hypothetical protein
MTDTPLEGQLVPSPAPGIRYEDEGADTVTRVLIRVERADGSVKEYEAREPADWKMTDPESISSMRIAGTMGVQPLGQPGFTQVRQAMPSMSLSFTANPRYNLHIRTRQIVDDWMTQTARQARAQDKAADSLMEIAQVLGSLSGEIKNNASAVRLLVESHLPVASDGQG